jgi:hypothetical protein
MVWITGLWCAICGSACRRQFRSLPYPEDPRQRVIGCVSWAPHSKSGSRRLIFDRGNMGLRPHERQDKRFRAHQFVRIHLDSLRPDMATLGWGAGLDSRDGSSRVASQEGFERAAGRTADPSTSLRYGRDDKGRGVAQVGVVAGWGETAGPSTSLRYGRDDKGRGVSGWSGCGMGRNRRSLHFATLRSG